MLRPLQSGKLSVGIAEKIRDNETITVAAKEKPPLKKLFSSILE